MSFEQVSEERTALDYAGIAVAVLIVGGFLGVGIFGLTSPFLPTQAYEDATAIIGCVCGAISGLAGLYLFVEIIPAPNGRTILFACIGCACCGYLSALKGVPVVYGNFDARPTSLVFHVAYGNFGSKSCRSESFTAEHPDYVDLSFCATNYGLRVAAGDNIRITGHASAWGFRYDTIEKW